MQQQDRQQRPALAATHHQRPTTTEDLKRAQQTEFHRDRPAPNAIAPAPRNGNLRRKLAAGTFDDPNCQAATPGGSGLALFIVRVVHGPVRDAR
jgi:hypothetical protein